VELVDSVYDVAVMEENDIHNSITKNLDLTQLFIKKNKSLFDHE